MEFWRDYAGDPLKVLVVCTGNICRSPLGEVLLEQRLGQAGLPARVTSAGTGAVVGSGMTAEIAAIARDLGVRSTGHVARAVTPELLADADLVLTATRSHRAATVGELPRSVRYTFTLREFARLSAGAQDEGFSADERRSPVALVEAIGAFRGFLPAPADPTDDDVVDPFRRSAAVHAEAARHIDAATRTIAAVLTDPRAGLDA